jgi:hypothetical protein
MAGRRLTVWLIPLLLLFGSANAHEKRLGNDVPKETVVVGKVVLLFDVSPSMVTGADDLSREGKAAEKPRCPQDQVIRFLTDKKAAFVKRLQQKGPVFAYRFGGRLDPDFVVFAEGRTWSPTDWEKYQASPEPRKVPKGQPWGKADWESWLKPALKTPKQRNLFGTSNVEASLIQLLRKEANSLKIGVIVVSNGRGTEGNETAIREVADLVARTQVPLFTVAAGRTDLDQFYSLASPATRFTKHLDYRTRTTLRIALLDAAKPVMVNREEERLFFDLQAAHLIPDCVVRVKHTVIRRKDR